MMKSNNIYLWLFADAQNVLSPSEMDIIMHGGKLYIRYFCWRRLNKCVDMNVSGQTATQNDVALETDDLERRPPFVCAEGTFSGN